MSTTLRIVLLITTIIYLIIIVKSIKSRKLQLSFSIFWILMSLGMLFAAIFPTTISWFADFLGFEITSNMVFFIGFFIGAYLLFTLTIRLSKENDRNRKLIQEVSMLKQKVEKIENSERDKNE